MAAFRKMSQWDLKLGFFFLTKCFSVLQRENIINRIFIMYECTVIMERERDKERRKDFKETLVQHV